MNGEGVNCNRIYTYTYEHFSSSEPIDGDDDDLRHRSFQPICLHPRCWLSPFFAEIAP